jgi:hypothetical protein
MQPREKRMKLDVKAVVQVSGLIWLGTALNAHAATHIYQCVVDGRPVYSDQPCQTPRQEEIPLREVNSYTPVPVPLPSAPVKQNRTQAPRARAQAEDLARQQQKQQQMCAKLWYSLDRVRSKLRTGYRASEDNNLHARERHLSQMQRLNRC